MSMTYDDLPLKNALDRYIRAGECLGHFLSAVVSNDLKEACGRADDTNLPFIPLYVQYLYNEAPGACWGSKERMEAWHEKFSAPTPDSKSSRAEFCHDILTTAIEGGINYWARGRNFERDSELNYLSCELEPHNEEGPAFECDDPRNFWQKVDAEKILVAVNKIIAENDLCSSGIRDCVTLAARDSDACHLDAECCDVIIQVAMFGEIVFG